MLRVEYAQWDCALTLRANVSCILLANLRRTDVYQIESYPLHKVTIITAQGPC
eukprot:SAG31_NODE_225_length_19846_cov_19.057983_7_plen_53_part_00